MNRHIIRLVPVLVTVCLMSGCGADDEAAKKSKQDIDALTAKIAELESQVESLREEKSTVEASLKAENETLKQELRAEFEKRMADLREMYADRVQELGGKLADLHLQLGQTIQEKTVLEKRLAGGIAAEDTASFAVERTVWIVLLVFAMAALAYFVTDKFRRKRSPRGDHWGATGDDSGATQSD